MAESITVFVRLFAAPREAVGSGRIALTLDAGATVEDLLDHLSRAYPVLLRYLRYLHVTVNRAYADRQTLLRDRDEVACLPPVGGG